MISKKKTSLDPLRNKIHVSRKKQKEEEEEKGKQASPAKDLLRSIIYDKKNGLVWRRCVAGDRENRGTTRRHSSRER